jgi:hypothetical protein
VRPVDCCICFRSISGAGDFFMHVVDGAAFILASEKLITYFLIDF